MTQHKANIKGEKALSELIRKEIGSESNRRLLARLPAFKADGALPDRLIALLGEIDRAEGAA